MLECLCTGWHGRRQERGETGCSSRLRFQFLSLPTPPCFLLTSLKGTRQSRKPLQRPLRSPKGFMILKCFSDYRKLIYASLLNAATFTKCFVSHTAFYSLQRPLQSKNAWLSREDFTICKPWSRPLSHVNCRIAAQ